MLAPSGPRPSDTAVLPRGLPPVPFRSAGATGDRPRAVLLQTGAPALDAFLPPFIGGECVLVDSGHPFVFSLALDLCAQAVGRAGGSVIYLDGGNSMDPTLFPALSRRHRVDREMLLDRIQVARAFTAYQLTALVEETLPQVLDDSVNLVVAACFPELYLDQEIPVREARTLAERAMGSLRSAAVHHGVAVVATNYGLTKLARAPGFRPSLYGAVDRVIRIESRRRGIRVKLPATGRWVDYAPTVWAQRTIEEFGAAGAGG